jgi:hypothetical protein
MTRFLQILLASWLGSCWNGGPNFYWDGKGVGGRWLCGQSAAPCRSQR